MLPFQTPILCKIYNAVSFIPVYVLCIVRVVLDDDNIYNPPILDCQHDEAERSEPQRKGTNTGHFVSLTQVYHMSPDRYKSVASASAGCSPDRLLPQIAHRMSFKGHTVVITGAGGGLGKA